MDFYALEDATGVRASWNVLPPSRLEAARMVVPVGVVLTPLKKSPKITQVPYEPILCRGPCKSVLNPYCSADVRGKIWSCPFCFQRNQFPAHYAEISETNLPAELIPEYGTSMDYVLPRGVGTPPIFLYVIDTCLDDYENEMQSLKDALLMSLSLLPENALVGLITFGSTVRVYELSFEQCPKSYVFRGTKDVALKQVQELLALGVPFAGQRPASAPGAPAPSAQQPSSRNRFLMPLSECEFTFETILEELQLDPQPAKKTERRQHRCTGVAMSVAASLLESTYPNCGARIMMFTGGPPTIGPGMVVSDEKKDPIRVHHDLQKEEAKYYASASKYFSQLASRIANSGHCVDLFACSLNQIGLLEMRDMLKKTGGMSILADSFNTPMFRDSFRTIFDRDEKGELDMFLNATLEVTCSKELRVCGAIGHLESAKKKGPCVGETEIGAGGTQAWKLAGLNSNSSYALYFEVVSQHTQQPAPGSRALLQFTTAYQNSKGQRVLRVTTVAHPWADLSLGTTQLKYGFDQEAAAVLMARLAMYKAEQDEYSSNIVRWLDKMLIKFCNRFADYQPDNPDSFQIQPNLSLYPQFMFYLRRSHMIQVFNNSPDETTYKRYILQQQTVGNSMVMIQPSLDAYSFQGPPKPVLLSATSLGADKVLLLDTFFEIVVWHGAQIADWRNKKFQEQPEYSNLKAMLEAPQQQAAELMKGRFPQPRYISSDQGSSQARFLLALVDPDVTHHTNPYGGAPVITDDVSLSVFMDYLRKLAVQQQ